MENKKITLGQAIDQIIGALESLEPDSRQTAIDAACSHLGINPPTTSQEVLSKPLPGLIAAQQTPATPQNSMKIDIRTLKDQKQPVSAKQMACVVAYYLMELAPESELKASVNAKDLEKYFKQAKFKLPKTIQQILPDAKQSGYFDSAGKGEYSLNAVGYNLVAHNLPKNKVK